MDNSHNFLPQPPALVNPPPQIFGSYSADGSPIQPQLPANMFDDAMMMGSQDGNDEGQGDPKRRRIARACDMCRKKKIKCDGKMPSCTHCTNYKTECVFTQVEKKRQPPKGAKYIEGLENRLGRMESLLRLSGLLSEDDDGRTDLGTLEKRLSEKRAAGPNTGTTSSRASHDGGSTQQRDEGSPSQRGTPAQAAELSSPRSPVTSPAPSRPARNSTQEPPPRNEEEVESLSDMMCSLVTNNCGETRYIGSSSGFSIFSPKGIQWVNDKTGDTSFQDMITNAAVDDNKWIHWKPDIFRDIFSRRVFKPLPPKEEALSLLKDYFANFNCMFPLFHEPTFMHLVDKHYSEDPYEGSGWWASLNVVLAIAHRLRVMSNLVPQEEDQKAWGYLKNALAVQTELTIRNTDLLSVQALLGMALFLQGTPNPQPSFFLVAAAIRLSHSIGLHKRGSGFNLNPAEIEQRKRVFWIAYMLDRDICLRSGRPPIQDDDDMNVELPSENPPDNIGNIPLADGKKKVNLFRLMCTFAVIESKVYKSLYSVKASKQSDGELLNTIGELDRELEEWKDGIPIDFRPEHEIKASHTPLILHVVVLHFAYYNCLTTIHRMSVHHGYWTSRLSNFAIQGLNARPLNPRVFSSAALCVQAARASINLIKYIPQGDYACVWLILYYPVSSLVTLFANILQNPQDTRTKSDLKLMNLVVNFLSTLCSDEENGSVRRMLSICSEFERIARVVLEKADKESSSKRKRRQQDDQNKDGQQQHGAQSINQMQQQQRSDSRRSSSLTPSVNGNAGSGFPHFTSNFANPNFNFSPSMPHASLQQGSWLPDLSSPQTVPAFLPQQTFPHSQTGTDASASNSGFSTATGVHPASERTSGPTALNGGHLHDFDMGAAFQQPFVPQDLWQMPMTLEWDWADMTGYGGIDDGMGGMSMSGVINMNHPTGQNQEMHDAQRQSPHQRNETVPS
ncbi:fungal specific transcription factor domain-containing protein [Diplodia corticola]|uniref:Fungal specific transcription factor domain-containing protein n=1 Tax=Diplodia corticola TaxID=236234 RepID=A0A1J9R6U5_9PEZI|nr:fungal specific transcription factor domain-containing protein [Diplodia corticola]OJD36257.1 fungal specific transcription factor domain-containing protein [Diplodia corticola]